MQQVLLVRVRGGGHAQLSGGHCPANDNEDSEVAVAQILVCLSLKTGATTKGATVAPANPVFSTKPTQYRV